MDVVELCSQLVAIPSITDSINELGPLHLLQKIFTENNIHYELFGSENKQSLVASIGEGEKSVMLNSHFDVVPAENELFLPYISEERLYGRGSADAKGSLASMLMAFLNLQKMPLKGRVLFCAVCDEENAGHFGTRVLSDQEVKATYNIFGEPTNFQVIIAEKGFLRLKVTVFGKEAHAAFPEKGENAIKAASDIIQEINAISWNCEHRLLSPPTISYGTIEGGSKINVVAGECILGIDIRYLPGQDESEIRKKIFEIARKRAKSRVEVISSGPPLETSDTSQLVQMAVRVTGQPAVGVNFATDARFYQGSDSIVLGPGDPELAHQKTEYVRISDLKKAVKMYTEIVSQLLV